MRTPVQQPDITNAALQWHAQASQHLQKLTGKQVRMSAFAHERGQTKP
jgi:hypothetical protein